MAKHTKIKVSSKTRSRNPGAKLGWSETSRNARTLRRIEKAKDDEKNI